jgi:predicted porin
MSSNLGRALASALALTAAGIAHAQSNVTIYGLLDAGVNYVDNVRGASHKSVDSGQSSATRLGFRGKEDLGGGWSAIFTLEHQIRVDTGAQQNAASFWNRGAFVGLSNPQLGTLTVGRQIDFMNVDLPPESAPMLTGGQAAGWQSAVSGVGANLNLDVHYGTTVYDNTIKWKHELGPVKFGLMYGLGNENRTDKMAGAFATYYAGALSVGAGIIRDNYVATTFARRTAGIKLYYRPKGWGLFANIAKASDPRNQAEIVPWELGVLYDLTPNILIGGGAGFAKVTDTIGRSARLTQPYLGAKYIFSPRADVYVMYARNETSNRAVIGATVSGPGGAPGISSDDVQQGLRAGIRIRF